MLDCARINVESRTFSLERRKAEAEEGDVLVHTDEKGRKRSKGGEEIRLLSSSSSPPCTEVGGATVNLYDKLGEGRHCKGEEEGKWQHGEHKFS